MLRREVAGHFVQIGIRQARQQVRHGPVLAPVVAEIEQLVVEVFLRLAGQARVITVGAGAALLAVTGRTGRHPGRHGAGLQYLGRVLGQHGGCGKGHNGGGQKPGFCPKPWQ